MASLDFDHVMLVARDIDAAAARLLVEHGLGSSAGGRHTGHGTGNRIVPLGDSYIEIIGIIDEEEAGESPLGRWVYENTAEGDRLIALCLRTYDLDATAARLGLTPISMSRSRPDGAVLRWKLVGLDEMLADSARPFFITWESRPELYPGREEASHRVHPEGVAWVEMGAEEADLSGWVDHDALDLRAVDGHHGVAAVGIKTGEGILELRN